MEILVEWLQYFFDEPLPNAQELARLITAHSYEVEEVKETEQGPVLVIDVLPNRGHDSLSHYGVARELAVLLDREVKSPFVDFEGQTSGERIADLIEFSIPDDGIVRRASKRVIKNVEIKGAPSWMKGRLEAIGQRSINSVVDATNYVTLEMGQPVHAFDYDKIAGEGKKNIYIRYAKEGEQITLLDGSEHELNPTMLVIADDEGPLDVAGVKGGSRAAIDEETKNVLLSVCNFDPTNIRKTCEQLKVHTDAAKRFKQELTPEYVELGMERLTNLVHEVAGGEVSEDVLDIYPEHPATATLSVTLDEVNALLGGELTEEQLESVLVRMQRADFTFEKNQEEYVVTVPIERLDLLNPGRGEYSGGNKADLIEEIGRIVGYESIADQLPSLELSPKPLKSYYYSEFVRQTLIGLGFSEVYTYSFVDEGSGKKHVRVENPIAENKGYLRHRLSYLLNQKLDENLKNADLLGSETIKMFEIGTVFTQEREWLSLGLGIKGKKGRDKGSLAQAKEALEEALSVSLEAIEDDSVLEIDFSSLLERLPEPKTYDDLDQLPSSQVVYEPFSIYPFISRDMAVWLPEEANKDDLEQLMYKHGTDLLKGIRLFDSFTKDGRTSYAYRLVFQSHEKTLTDDEVNTIMDVMYEDAGKQPGWEIR